MQLFAVVEELLTLSIASWGCFVFISAYYISASRIYRVEWPTRRLPRFTVNLQRRKTLATRLLHNALQLRTKSLAL